MLFIRRENARNLKVWEQREPGVSWSVAPLIPIIADSRGVGQHQARSVASYGKICYQSAAVGAGAGVVDLHSEQDPGPDVTVASGRAGHLSVVGPGGV